MVGCNYIKFTKDGRNLNDNFFSKSPNLDVNINKKLINSHTVFVNQSKKIGGKSSKSMNMKNNSTTNLVNNFEFSNKLDKCNMNPKNTQIGYNIIKSYQDLNELNCLSNNILKEKNNLIINNKINTNITIGKNNAIKNNINNFIGNKSINSKNKKSPIKFNNYSNYKMIKPQKNLITSNINNAISKSYLSQGIKNVKKSIEFDKLKLNVSNLKNKINDPNICNNITEYNSESYKDSSSQQNKNPGNSTSQKNNFVLNSSVSIHNNFINDQSSIENSSLNKNRNTKIFTNIKGNDQIEIDGNYWDLEKINNQASKFSRNDKKNILSNLYLNTVNESYNIDGIDFTKYNFSTKNDSSCFNTYNNQNMPNYKKNMQSSGEKNKIKNKNNKSIDSMKNLYLGLNNQSASCINKDQKKFTFDKDSYMSVGSKYKNFNNNLIDNSMKTNNISHTNNDRSCADLYNNFVVNTDSNKIIDEIATSQKTIYTNNFNSPNLDIPEYENKKSKKNLITQNKKIKCNSQFSVNLNNNFHQNVNIDSEFYTETNSNKKFSRESKFKVESLYHNLNKKY